jgi:hypothetical protein
VHTAGTDLDHEQAVQALQGHRALIMLDRQLAGAVQDLVTVAPIEALY